MYVFVKIIVSNLCKLAACAVWAVCWLPGLGFRNSEVCDCVGDARCLLRILACRTLHNGFCPGQHFWRKYFQFSYNGKSIAASGFSEVFTTHCSSWMCGIFGLFSYATIQTVLVEQKASSLQSIIGTTPAQRPRQAQWTAQPAQAAHNGLERVNIGLIRRARD